MIRAMFRRLYKKKYKGYFFRVMGEQRVERNREAAKRRRQEAERRIHAGL